MKIAVTGVFGYSGRYIAERLLARGDEVITLTNSPGRHSPLHGRVAAYPLCFEHPAGLEAALRGVDVLVNTYWVRFNDPQFTHAQAVANSKVLFEAARKAGVGRIVHVSIANPEAGAGLEYYDGKWELERFLGTLGVPCSILRPTVLFGREDILLNNIAWSVRNFRILPVFGDGSYRIRPIHVDDLAALVCEESLGAGHRVVNAVGQESYTYRDLVHACGRAIGVRAFTVGVPHWFGFAGGKFIGWYQRDRFLTWEEVKGLTRGLLHVDGPGVGSIRLGEWMRDNRETLGKTYASELRRRRDRGCAYLV